MHFKKHQKKNQLLSNSALKMTNPKSWHWPGMYNYLSSVTTKGNSKQDGHGWRKTICPQYCGTRPE